ELRPIVFLTAISVLGILLLVPVAAVEWVIGARLRLDGPTLAAVGYVGLFASVAAYLAWNRGVAAVG
ncbi:MAG: EamA/RhaT family transporter, partial [Gemmatimonadetes bacterium]|nr:EamA/RhaT family transporter [Gemmatimonadota bacterium]NIR35038.1 EamA/RhaT family transporter [Actinomycetota bacterium]NIS29085.1 EamA/RhaT family transporter [Actinomycetota bacterium]NIT94332.1 EamA/RhaT family transporter [Actinomycetota bacterium]NIU64491.1 EamA/RhaT family transporter [Actinomycetota bacterium]